MDASGLEPIANYWGVDAATLAAALNESNPREEIIIRSASQSPSEHILDDEEEEAWDDGFTAHGMHQEAPASESNVVERMEEELLDLTHATNRAEKIFEDLANGEYDCPSCYDTIINTSPIWSCDTCHHVYHISCIEAWAESVPWPWTCPSCKTLLTSQPEARCWCGRKSHDALTEEGNTCGETCHKRIACKRKICKWNCENLCHPGPCVLPECSEQCRGLPAALPRAKVRPKVVKRTTYEAAWEQGGARLNSQLPPRLTSQIERDLAIASANSAINGRTVNTLANSRRRAPLVVGPTLAAQILERERKKRRRNIWLVVLQILIQVFVITFGLAGHVKWWTDPLRYRDFTEHWQGVESGLTIFLVICLTILCFGLGLMIFKMRVPFLRWLGVYQKPDSPELIINMLWSVVFWCCVLCAMLVFIGGPGWERRTKFKHSCDGFDTRTTLDDREYLIPSSEFVLWNSNAPHSEEINRRYGFNKFTIAEHIDYTTNTTEPFYSSIRVTGKLNARDEAMYIDYDLVSSLWRISQNNNKPARNGSWHLIPGTQHISLDSLNLIAPNLGLYTKNCQYQPYMTVYRSDGMSNAEIEKQNEQHWKSSSENNVVMRTASFGRSINELQVCSRKTDYHVGGGGNTFRGLGDDIVIPLGLLAVMRTQMVIDGRYKGACRWHLA